MYAGKFNNVEAAMDHIDDGCIFYASHGGFHFWVGTHIDMVKRLFDLYPDRKSDVVTFISNCSYQIRRMFLDAGYDNDRINEALANGMRGLSVYVTQDYGYGKRALRVGRDNSKPGMVNAASIVLKKKGLNDKTFAEVFGGFGDGDRLVAVYKEAIEKEVGKRVPDEFGAFEQTPADAAAPVTVPEPAPAPADPFMTALRAAFINTVGDNLVEQLVPTLKQKVIDEFGFEPQRHEVKVADRVVRFDGVTHERFDVVLNLVANDVPVYMYGPAGSGKGVLVKQVAKSLGLDFYAMNSVTDEFKITGFVDANGNYCESEFYRAFTQGGVFFLDEMDASAPEVLVCLNMAIADRYYTFPTGRVDAHPDFRVVAAGNTLGTGADASYTGRLQLDAASLNRFVVVEVDYDRRIDMMEAQNDSELVAFIDRYRKVAAKNGVNTVASYRNIHQIKVMEAFADLKDVLASCLTKSLNQDDINTMVGAGGWPESNRYFAAFKSMRAFS
jgi:hypothetical protein